MEWAIPFRNEFFAKVMASKQERPLLLCAGFGDEGLGLLLANPVNGEEVRLLSAPCGRPWSEYWKWTSVLPAFAHEVREPIHFAPHFTSRRIVEQVNADLRGAESADEVLRHELGIVGGEIHVDL